MQFGKYQGLWFRNCSDAKILEYFGKTQTYIDNYHNNKICSEAWEEFYTDII